MDPFGPKRYYFLIRIQFLGFRYHGWQKQPGVKTIQGMVEKTIRYVLGEEVGFKTLGASRTDAMVSAEDFPFELFLAQALSHTFLEEFNLNLPSDIHALSIGEVSPDFNVIQDVKMKEYHYHFSYGQDKNPFQAAVSTHISGNPNISQMQKAAYLYMGEHDYRAFTYPLQQDEVKLRTIENAEIVKLKNDHNYLFKVRGQGFMRYQVRYMMGALFEIGKGNLEYEELHGLLSYAEQHRNIPKAPASGLRLKSVEY